jgi:hypothetical protein
VRRCRTRSSASTLSTSSSSPARPSTRVRRAEWNAHGKSKTETGKRVKGVRWSLLKAPERQSATQLAKLHEVQHANKRLDRAFLL